MSKEKRIKFLICVIFVILIFALYFFEHTNKSDPELNPTFSPIGSGMYSYHKSNVDGKYYWYYEDKFQNLSIDVIALSMGLDWFVRQYDEVYTGKEEYFYISAFDTINFSTKELVNIYNKDPDRLYYLKPYIDCYLLMDKSKKPSDEELEHIKETILYALEYYINGKDFVGTLDE